MKSVLRLLLAVFFVGAGANHFLSAEFYRGIMPSYFPWHAELVAISGVAEILGGAGVLIPRTRRFAAWGLIALLIAVLPVHIEMIIHSFRSAPAWLLWLRLPFQLILVAWVYWSCLNRTSEWSCEKESNRT
jgi:uncharacterized membrane protein